LPQTTLIKRNPGDVYGRLRALILNRCQPGDALSEPELAKMLKVSRTPVREALARLERDGLVVIVPRRGAFVKSLEVIDIHELFEVREAIETYEIRQVAKRIDLRELEALERKMDDLYARLHRNRGLSAGERFSALFGLFQELHELILNARRNRRFLDIIRNLGGPWSLARRKLLDGLGIEALEQGYKEHQEIIKALKQRNPVTAERAMRMHLRQSRRRYVLAHER